jgi:hypothetical protein
MAAFEVVEAPLRTIWMPVGTAAGANTANTLYVGQLVTNTVGTTSSGAFQFVQSGTPDTRAPFGVVVGTNNKEPVFSTTANSEYITSAVDQAGVTARKSAGLGEMGGMYVPGDNRAYVKVAVIGADTVLKGRLFAGAYGTALTVGTVSTGSGTGAGYTCAVAGLGVTRIAYNSTHFFRTGLNSGLYNVSYDTGSTLQATTFYAYWPFDITVGDKVVCVNLAQGITNITFDALGLYVDAQAAQTATQVAEILEINLSVAGSEYVIFRFNPRLV